LLRALPGVQHENLARTLHPRHSRNASPAIALPPLEVIAKACVDLAIRDATARNIFDSYDRFLGILDDQAKRSELEKARTHDDLRNSAAWEEVRAVSNPFHDGLVALFLKEHDTLQDLTMKYGLF
jgi:hypothetical protein